MISNISQRVGNLASPPRKVLCEPGRSPPLQKGAMQCKPRMTRTACRRTRTSWSPRRRPAYSRNPNGDPKTEFKTLLITL